MKHKRLIYAVFSCIIAVSLIAFASCESTEEISLTEEEKGSVEVVITDSSGAEITNAETKIEVSSEQSSSLSFSQKSSYADDNGTVYTVEPTATVGVTVDLETINVTSIRDLTNIVAEDLISETSGTNPALNTAKQVFNIGGQSVTFETSYEVYTYTNSSSTQIEMPYLSILTPTLSDSESSESTETKAGGVSVSLSKVVATKATITEYQTYDVVATFDVEIESENTADEFSKTLTFDVVYTGVVATDTEVDDFYSALDYTVMNNGVDVGDETAFVISDTNLATLTFDETSAYYTYLDEKVASVANQATISMQMSYDNFKSFSEESITTGSVETTDNKTVITHGRQTITLEIANSTNSYSDDEYKDVEAPYLVVNTPTIASATVDSTTTNEDGSLKYVVSTVVEVVVETVGLSENYSKTYSFEFKYNTYVGEPVVVNTRYEHYMDWREAHDNIPYCGYACVDVIDEYDDGTEETTTHQDYGHLPMIGGTCSSNDEIEDLVPVINDGYSTDYVTCIEYHTVIISSDARDLYKDTDVKDLVTVIGDDFRAYTDKVVPGDYDNYNISREYEYDGKLYCWKYGFTGCLTSLTMYIGDLKILYATVGISPWDQFLDIDGTCIYFEDYWPTFESVIEIVDIEAPEGYEFAQTCELAIYAHEKDEITYKAIAIYTILYEYGTE